MGSHLASVRPRIHADIYPTRWVGGVLPTPRGRRVHGLMMVAINYMTEVNVDPTVLKSITTPFTPLNRSPLERELELVGCTKAVGMGSLEHGLWHITSPHLVAVTREWGMLMYSGCCSTQNPPHVMPSRGEEVGQIVAVHIERGRPSVVLQTWPRDQHSTGEAVGYVL